MKDLPRFTLVALSFLFCVLSGSGEAGAEGKVPKVFFGYSTDYERAPGAEHGSLYVKSVVPGGPADQAGILAGDRIVAFDGEPLRFRGRVDSIRGMHWVEPHRPLRLTVLRDAETLHLTMRPTPADPERQKALDRLLTKLESGAASCDDGMKAAEGILIDRVREAGGRALLEIRREGGDLRIHSEQVEIPEGFDLGPEYRIMTDTLEDGEVLSMLLKTEAHRVSWIPEGAPGFFRPRG